MNDTVGVYIECNLDLRNATACRHNSVKVENAEGLVVLSELSFALENMNLNRRLIVNSR